MGRGGSPGASSRIRPYLPSLSVRFPLRNFAPLPRSVAPTQPSSLFPSRSPSSFPACLSPSRTRPQPYSIYYRKERFQFRSEENRAGCGSGVQWMRPHVDKLGAMNGRMRGIRRRSLLLQNTGGRVLDARYRSRSSVGLHRERTHGTTAILPGAKSRELDCQGRQRNPEWAVSADAFGETARLLQSRRGSCWMAGGAGARLGRHQDRCGAGSNSVCVILSRWKMRC
jgi:hypothetical protein